LKALFKHACPNCEGRISDERLLLGVPCEKCLPLDIKELRDLYSKMGPLEFKIKIMEILKKQGNLQKYYDLVKIEKELAEFELLFKKGTGSRLWSAQREWARRVLKGISFAITAPTGIGKTVFGMSMAIYLSTKGKKSYIILPTTVLVKQTLDRIREFLEKAGIQVKVAGYYARLSKSEREEFKQMIETGDFDILITTSQYLALKFNEVSKHKFDFIFVDDVDALLKLSKNIDRVLLLLGFNNEIINLGLKLIKLKKEFLQARASKLEKIEYEIEETENTLNSLKETVKPGILIVSTATGKAKGDRVKLFRELLNFTIGSASEGYRNIQDLYMPREENVEKQVLSLVKKFGTGGLIFVTLEEGIEFAEKIANFLKENGIKAEAFHASKKSPEIIDQFSNGEIDVLIGVASHYGLLVRGLDLPHRVRYAIFTGVPKFRFSLDVSEETSPTRIYMLLSEIMEYLPEGEREKADNFLRKLRQYMVRLSPAQLQQIKDALTNKVKIDNMYLQNILNLYVKVINFVDSMLKRKDVLDKLRESPFVAIEEKDGKLYMLVPDVRTYIQASGRTSRLFAGGVAKGVSVLLVDNEKVFNGLVRQLRWRFEESEWKHLNDVNLDALLREIDADRELILKIKRGEITVELKDPVKSALLIVESPSKAFTISTFFGKPARRRLHGLPVYEVVTGDLDLNVAASGGHIFDLVTDEGFHGVLTENGLFVPIYTTIKRCMVCKEQFVEDTDKCPRCKSTQIKDSLNNVKALSEIASEVDMILIGTDPDTEGEKIGWDIATVLKPYARQIKRVEFHEITKMAIRNALENLKEIDENRVSAQLVRRIEDRWIGFELSRRLWQKFRDYHLSAGRVQTPVLGWIIERYKEFLKSWKYVYWVKLLNQYVVELKDIEGDPHKLAEKIRKSHVKIISIEEIQEDLNPPPPFTTDEMLREASRLLRFGAQETMALAQTLFESGLITYHRTDSHRVSNVGIRIAKEYITQEIGEEYFHARKWGAEEEGAHECIRPTRPLNVERLRSLIEEGVIKTAETMTWQHYKLYQLIFNRFMASQMTPAKIKRLKAKIKFNEIAEAEIEGIIEVIEPGFTILQPIKTIPKLKEPLSVIDVKFKKIPTVSLYTQGDIVELMKKRGIGRPSTYATIIQTLLERGYVEEKNKMLKPTKLGIKVYEYLSKFYNNLVSEERTRELERKMEEIEEGRIEYQYILKDLYQEIKNLK